MIRRIDKLTVKECFRDRKVSIAMCETQIEKDHLKKKGSCKIKAKQAVVYCPDGANILPYLFSKKHGWCVVLVKQYRIAVDTVTQEAPGGMVDGLDVGIKEGMARELREETGINVPSESIDVVFREYMLPPLLAAVAWGGIVKIKENQIPRKLRWGVKNEDEYTAVSVVPIKKLTKVCCGASIILDLWTSRLVAEVIKKIETLD